MKFAHVLYTHIPPPIDWITQNLFATTVYSCAHTVDMVSIACTCARILYCYHQHVISSKSLGRTEVWFMHALVTLAFSFLPLTTTTTAKQWNVMAKKQLCRISIFKAQILHCQYFSHNYYYYGGHNFAREFMIHNFDWCMSIYGLFLQSEWWLHERGHIGTVKWIKSLPLYSHISNSLFNSARVTKNQVHADKQLLDHTAISNNGSYHLKYYTAYFTLNVVMLLVSAWLVLSLS